MFVGLNLDFSIKIDTELIPHSHLSSHDILSMLTSVQCFSKKQSLLAN